MFSQMFNAIRGVLNKNVLIVLTLLFAALSIYIWGERMGYRGVYPLRDPNIRIFIAIGFLGAAGLFALFLIVRWIWRAIRNRRTSVKLEPTAEELEVRKMNSMFAQVTKTMRAKWEGRGNPVDHLPWYLVVGNQGSGKSTFIGTSDLRFPLDHEIRNATKPLGNGEAVNFVDWRVTGKEAVLLDIDGRHFTGEAERTDMQRALWDAFLRNIQKVRKSKSINGAIIVVDVLAFARSTTDERLEFADRVRRQLTYIIEKMGVRLPVYIVFSKIDLISGFQDFQLAVPKTEQEKLFGFHFEYKGDNTRDWLYQFEQQTEAYFGRVSDVMSTYLHRINSRESRREAFAFFRTMSGMVRQIRELMVEVFDEDKFSTTPLVRGIYFTSAKQENAPENLFLDVVSQQYALPAPAYATSQARSKPVFSAPLLASQIFPEAALAGSNRKKTRSNVRRNGFALVFWGGLFALTASYWFTAYRGNMARADELVKNIEEFQYAGLQIDTRTPPENYVPSLNLAQNASLQFDGWRDKPRLASLVTLDQGKTLGPYGDHVYLTALNTEFMPAMTDIVGERLRGVCPHGSEEELRLLRVYRMLGEPEKRRNEVISEYFKDDWQSQFQGDNAMQSTLTHNLEFALNNSNVRYPADQQIIQNSLAHLANIPPSLRVYSALRARANASLVKDIDLRIIGGSNFAYVYENDAKPTLASADTGFQGASFANNSGCAESVTDNTRQPLTVNEIYSRHAFSEFFMPNIDDAAELASNDLWVFDENSNIEYSDSDIEQVKERVWQTYTGDYVSAWDEAINELQLRPINNLSAAVVVTEALGSVDSPIRRVVEALADETTIFEEKEQEEELDVTQGTVDIAGLSAQVEFVAAADIQRSFVRYQQMAVPPTENGATKIDAITEASRALATFLSDITEQTNSSARALEVAVARANGTLVDDPIDNMRRVADGAPEPFRSQLISIADDSWRLILEEASFALNERWQNEIYNEYAANIAGRYPINRSSGDDIPVQAFASFFRPGGKLDAFYSESLSPFFDLRSGSPRVIDKQSLKLDPSAVAALANANNITQSYFDPSGQLNIQFTVTPVAMSRGLQQSIINIEGQTIVYSHGPAQSASVIWPNVVGGAGSRIDMSPRSRNGSSSSVSSSGEWSWLRLIDKGSSKNATSGSIDVSFATSGSQAVTYRFQTDGQNNPIIGTASAGFNLPTALSIEPQRFEALEDFNTQEILSDIRS